MQNIDISKLKNVKNSLSESEIFELNWILNNAEVYEKILQFQKISFLKAVQRGIFYSCWLLFIISSVIFCILFADWTIILLLPGIFLVLFFLIRDKFATRTLLNEGSSYVDYKKQIFIKIFWNKIFPVTKESDIDILFKNFVNKKILSQDDVIEESWVLFPNENKRRFFIADCAIFRWKRVRGLYRKMRFPNHTFYIQYTSTERKIWWDIKIKIKDKKQRFKERVLQTDVLFYLALWIILIWFPIFVFQWLWFAEGLGSIMAIFIAAPVWIFWFGWGVSMSRLKNIETDIGFSENFSVYSSVPKDVEIFSKKEIQKIFLDFIKNSHFIDDIYLCQDSIILFEKENASFLEFEYSFKMTNFIKPFVNFYIEQKNIQKFLEEIKVFYK